MKPQHLTTILPSHAFHPRLPYRRLSNGSARPSSSPNTAGVTDQKQNTATQQPRQMKNGQRETKPGRRLNPEIAKRLHGAGSRDSVTARTDCRREVFAGNESSGAEPKTHTRPRICDGKLQAITPALTGEAETESARENNELRAKSSVAERRRQEKLENSRIEATARGTESGRAGFSEPLRAETRMVRWRLYGAAKSFGTDLGKLSE
jgi:hypothetical protein